MCDRITRSIQVSCPSVDLGVDGAGTDMAINIKKILTGMLKIGASDLHLKVGQQPMIRLNRSSESRPRRPYGFASLFLLRATLLALLAFAESFFK